MLDRTRCPPVAPDFEQIMGQTHETPFTTDVVQAAQQKPAETSRFFDLAKHRFHDHFASGVHCTPFERLHFRCHAVCSGDGGLRHLSLRGTVSLTTRGHVWLKAFLLYGAGRCLTVIAAVIRGWNLL